MKSITLLILLSFNLYSAEKMNGSVLLKDIPIGSQFSFNGSLIRRAKKSCDINEKLSSFVDGKLNCVTSNSSLVERRFLLNGNPPDKKQLNCSLAAINRKEGDAIELVFDGSCNFFSITVSRAGLDNFFTKRNAGEIEANSFNYNLGSFGEVHFEHYQFDPHQVSDSNRTPGLEKSKDTIEDLMRHKINKE